MDSVFIVGAGFSMYAGMPLQKDFTDALLGGRGEGSGSSGLVVQHLRKFVNSAFDHKEIASGEFWPTLEDIFTCLDLSANTGHHLGPKFKAGELRTVRRALIYRIIVMLREKFKEARDNKNEKWTLLLTLMQKIGGSNSGFISTNWDTVIEDMLKETQEIEWFDYGCDAVRVSLHSGIGTIKVQEPETHRVRRVIKIHGSANWLYCDNCRRLFWIRSNQTGKVGDQLLSDDEWHKIAPETPIKKERWSCECGSRSLGTRLATFSYLKALDFPMFQKSWFSAEAMLREAKNWVFIGYSLPAADFEFKYLLKRVQLSRRKAPNFAVVSGGGDAEETYRHYQRFFGRKIKRDINCFLKGLNSETIQSIVSLTQSDP